MDAYSSKLHFSAEHKEFAKDLAWVLINYTPISGVIHTIKFGKKWLGEKRMPHRVASYIAENDRRSFIKARSRRIMASYGRPSAQRGIVQAPMLAIASRRAQ